MLALPALARAQGACPTRPIRIILPFPAGGAAHAPWRPFGDALGARRGPRVLVGNRPGAGGNPGTDAAAKAPPDGDTLLTGGPNVIDTHDLARDTPFRRERDLECLGLMFPAPDVLVVHPSVPARTVPEFLAQQRRAGLDALDDERLHPLAFPGGFADLIGERVGHQHHAVAVADQPVARRQRHVAAADLAAHLDDMQEERGGGRGVAAPEDRQAEPRDRLAVGDAAVNDDRRAPRSPAPGRARARRKPWPGDPAARRMPRAA